MADTHPLVLFYNTAQQIITRAAAAYDPDRPDPQFWQNFPSLDPLRGEAISRISAERLWGALGIDPAGLTRLLLTVTHHLGAATNIGFPSWGEDRAQSERRRGMVARECAAAHAACLQLEAVALILGATQSPNAHMSGQRNRRQGNEFLAMDLLRKHQDWTNKQIAAKLGINVKSMTPKRWKLFHALREELKLRSVPPRGHKSTDGNLEARDDEG
jgi:hypothetical protein